MGNAGGFGPGARGSREGGGFGASVGGLLSNTDASRAREHDCGVHVSDRRRCAPADGHAFRLASDGTWCCEACLRAVRRSREVQEKLFYPARSTAVSNQG